MAYRFICTHCGKKFELETAEAKECPFCYWSSSVKREDFPGAEKKSAVSLSHTANPAPRGKSPARNFSKTGKYAFRVFLMAGILAGVGVLGHYAYRTLTAGGEPTAKPFLISFKEKGKPVSKEKMIPEPMAFSAQEKEDLYREVSAVAEREPDAEETKILGRAAPFQTGGLENLPSVAWTPSQYEKMIGDQERLYKMPFSRSYKNKLAELFKTKYVAASDAFVKGDILSARNLWTESLVFPLYSKDLGKHRAVALTMLRPFINDTLAKIRAMNQILADQGQRAAEQSLTADYQSVLGLVAQKKWQEAVTAIEALIPKLIALGQLAKQPRSLPPYPAAFATVDQDIQPALMELMALNPSTFADLQPLQQDLVEKKEILATFTKAYVEQATGVYRNALELIHQQKWQDAIPLLESISGPRPLQEDAARKIAILQKKISGMDSSSRPRS